MRSSLDKKSFIVLWALSILGFLSLLPYMEHLGVLPATVSMGKIALFGSIQAALFFGLLCWISFKILPKTDLLAFPPLQKKRILKQMIYPAVAGGLLTGLAIVFLNHTIFSSSLLSNIHPPFWAGLLASIYGAINEEILLRLFLLTLLYFLAMKCLKAHKQHRNAALWTVTILVALIFGMGHLPMAFKLAPPSAFEISRVLCLNGIAGVVFGFLYWSKGLWTAITAHFIADLVIHVLLI
jgi:membrane protease YdiL (CAAX protease family)